MAGTLKTIAHAILYSHSMDCACTCTGVGNPRSAHLGSAAKEERGEGGNPYGGAEKTYRVTSQSLLTVWQGRWDGYLILTRAQSTTEVVSGLEEGERSV